MLAEVVDWIDVGSVNLPRHLLGFAVPDEPPEVVRVMVHHFVKSSGGRTAPKPL
jgi:hypothetical protein